MNGEWCFPTRLGQEKVSSSKLQEWLWSLPSLLFLAWCCYPDGVKRQEREAAFRFHLMPTKRLRGSIPPSPILFVVLCLPLPQIANGLAWDGIRTYVVRGR